MIELVITLDLRDNIYFILASRYAWVCLNYATVIKLINILIVKLISYYLNFKKMY